VYVRETFNLRVPTPAVDAPDHDDVDTFPGAITVVDLRDSDPAGHTYDRGPFTIRAMSSLRLRGTVEPSIRRGAVRLHGPAEAWYPLPVSQGPRESAFDEVFDIGGLPVGGYELSVYASDSADAPLRPASWASLEIAEPHWTLPEALTPLRQGREALGFRVTDASPRVTASAAGGDTFRRGSPLLVEGAWADPFGDPALTVFARVDERRPIPMSVQVSPHRFAGIVDTSRFETGPHRLEVWAIGRQGGGYYVAARFAFRLTSPSEA
jgi:hypothetical protein